MKEEEKRVGNSGEFAIEEGKKQTAFPGEFATEEGGD
jgi:hypothetical protein